MKKKKNEKKKMKKKRKLIKLILKSLKLLNSKRGIICKSIFEVLQINKSYF
jgi:hypothetical protein